MKKGKKGHWLNGKDVQQVSTLGWTKKILLNFIVNAKESLGIISSTVTAFLKDKLTPEQCKELQKIMNIDLKLYRKVFIYRG